MRLEDLIEQNYHKLSENDLYIWEYIHRHPDECRSISIDQLSAACNISHTTILRFAKKLGLKGFSELKIVLKWQQPAGGGSFPQDTLERSVQDYRQTLEYMSSVELGDLFSLMDSAGKIYVYGSGSVQQLAARDLKQKFFTANKLLYVVEGEEEMRHLTDRIAENDLVFLISLSGDNAFVNQTAECIKHRGGVVASICRIQSNRLIYLSDINIPFFTHQIDLGTNIEYWPTNLLFMINEFLILRYLQYRSGHAG
ncbi:MAG TPA: MurR/RpiR family transcriptional regulator [Candidatus Agathobaculum merdavium]|nr:MurR/RpiR family transcriptional regulator [Candidatus Agathobaculum merdavium]